MRERLVPPRLRAGDRIGIVTPSWPLAMSPSPDPHAEFERGLDALRGLGLDPVLGEHALADTGYQAGSPQQRAADLNGFFADRSIRAVVASHGGHVAYGVLGHLDWEAIAGDPKVVMGFSNVTTLLLALHARTGLVTFHGNTVIWHLGMEPSPYDLDEITKVLVDGRVGAVAKNSEWVTVRGGEPAEGFLVGEAMGMRGLAATAYQVPIDDDLILFFEGDADAPGITDTALRHLDDMGVFGHTRGVLVGHDGRSFTGRTPEVPFAEILLEVTDGYDFPIVQCEDFGHGCPNTVLPVGIRARLDPGTATLEYLEPTVGGTDIDG